MEYLGADPLDVRLVESAMPPVPDCEGWRKPEVLPPGKTCQSYADPCSFHALLGQLWSRKELYSMAKAHEARRGLHFDLFLYMRPDLTATIPLLPWCYYPLNIARHLHDWIWFVPRAAASALFESVPDDYYKCRSEYTRKLFHDAWNHVTDFKERDGDKRPQSDAIGGFKGIHMTGFDIENWMKVRAAAHGVQLYLDDSLGTLALTRTNIRDSRISSTAATWRLHCGPSRRQSKRISLWQRRPPGMGRTTPITSWRRSSYSSR